MSAPLTSLLLTDNDDSPALTLDDYKQAQAIVILGGGSLPNKRTVCRNNFWRTATRTFTLARHFYKKKRACLF